MNKDQVTMDAFLASKTRCEDIGKAISADLDGIRPGFLYFDVLYIEDMGDGRFYLNIERADWIATDIRELEARLFIFAKEEW